MNKMFKSFPKVTRLRKDIYDKFWCKAIKELEQRLRYPNKTLKWEKADLCKDMKKVGGNDLTIVYKKPLESSSKQTSVTRKTKSVVDMRPTHKMTLRPRKTVTTTIAALDPGVRTFQTLYDTENNVIEFGVGDVYLYQLDKKGLKTKIKNIHKRLAKFLCNRYGLIMIPRLEIENSKDPYLAVWDHPGFVDRLFDQAKKTKNCKVVEVEEKWTSKTCSSCGKINNVGKSKTLVCWNCALVIDRDINGARNILLKNMNILGIDLRRQTATCE